MHVLVVEDDERVAGHVVKGLKGEGWLVDHVADGRQALFQVAAESYDVIVLDRMLPSVDGMKILQTMRASGDSTPVLILSALGYSPACLVASRRVSSPGPWPAQ